MINGHFLELCKLRAQWWMTSAITGHAKTRNLTHFDGIPFTDEEKINDAMETAHRHIELYQEHIDATNDPED